MSLAAIAAATMLAGLIVYVLTAGADFGGGVWDLLASGPRAREQRTLVERAIAPIWEANHVWLIFVVVVLFTGFPSAYAAAGIALHIPLALMLGGIVLRGSAFVFRQYGGGDAAESRGWGLVFSLSSVVTPVFLGITVAAISSGEIRIVDGLPTTGYLAGWLGVFPLAVGGLALSLCAFLAAVYLTVEAKAPELRDDFRRRALGAGVAVAPFALVAALTTPTAGGFADRFLHSTWTWPLQLTTAAVAVSALAAIYLRRARLARALAAGQVVLILLGWALAQRPYLIAPDLTIEATAAPERTLSLMLIIVAAGALLLVPSLYYLFRVFKRT